MNSEKLGHLLKCYTHLSERERNILTKVLVKEQPGSIIYSASLEREGFKTSDIYIAMDKLGSKGLIDKMWQPCCRACYKNISEVKSNLWEVDTEVCPYCGSSDIKNMLVYQIKEN